MNVLNARVNWNLGWNTGPHLEILVDRFPKESELRYRFKEGMFFAEKDGYVSFLAHNGDEKNHGGFCGREFTVIMESGEEKVLRGPWSGRSGVTNQLGFTPCMEVSFTDDPKAFELGYTFCSGAITLEMAEKAIKFTDAHLIRVEKWEGEVYYEIHNTDDDCEVCKGFRTYVGHSGIEEICRWCNGTGHSRKKTHLLRKVLRRRD